MFIEYHFKIQYTRGTENARAGALSRKTELQNKEGHLGAILRKDKNRLIRYNYPKLVVIRKESRTYKVLESI